VYVTSIKLQQYLHKSRIHYQIPNTFYWIQIQSAGSLAIIQERKISNTISSISHPASSKETLPYRENRIQPCNKHNEKRKLLSYKYSSA
jgi:hypothetical protein